ncbi:hypothetical protein SAMN05421636_10618 [Pricia antarctica]|uniref:Uncharacterized protein n=1 Tax=Pricia antarctica TaxID=641691 RepID=A0A1G7E3Z9_9FLAO|nr:hypothetical protein [Pricia antarctica]SDE58427.1 hypothetical protein SAMN05421636_10618 [Pricia antarctica]
MRKILFLVFLIGLSSCDDGDLQIEQVDFDASKIESCPGLADPTQTTFFFKIDQDEALLLNLAGGLINNATSEPGTLASTIPEPSNLIYRFFSGNVTSAYFCDAIPPLEPSVVKENLATAGNISIDTKVDTLTAETKDYRHTISITDLSLKNDKGEQLTDLSTLVYGDLITKPKNSAKLEVPFSNYSDILPTACSIAPVDGTIRLFKVINDEFIALNVATTDNMFLNEATDSIPRNLDLMDKEVFTYTVFDSLANNDLACAATYGDDLKSWRFVSTAGNLKVETVASAPDANGSITYTHTITLENMVLTSKAGGANINLAAIPSVGFGTYVTIQ